MSSNMSLVVENQPTSEPVLAPTEEDGADVDKRANKRSIDNVSKDSEGLTTPPSKKAADPTCDPWLITFIANIVKEETVSLSNEITSLKEELRKVNASIERLVSDSSYMKQKADDLEQYSRRQNVRIHGVTEALSEETDTVVINELKDHIGFQLKPEEISVSHRVGKPRNDKPRAIICQLASKKTKSSIFTAVKAEKVRREEEETDVDAKRIPIHIVDDLTNQRATLLSEAKKAQKGGKILGAWTINGKVKIRCLDHSVKYIFTLNDFYRIMNGPQPSQSRNQNGLRGGNVNPGVPRHSTPVPAPIPPPHPGFYRFPPPGYQVQYNPSMSMNLLPRYRAPHPPHGQNPLDEQWPTVHANRGRPQLPGQHMRRPSY